MRTFNDGKPQCAGSYDGLDQLTIKWIKIFNIKKMWGWDSLGSPIIFYRIIGSSNALFWNTL